MQCEPADLLRRFPDRALPRRRSWRAPSGLRAQSEPARERLVGAWGRVRPRPVAYGSTAVSPVTVAPDPDDAALIERCRAGEERAFELLFQRHSGPVTRLVYRMVG